MKKSMFAFISLLVALFVLSACSNNEDVLVIGATSEPHAVILEKAKPILEEKGIKLDIKVFSKYELINPALNQGDIDANYFQHIPYFNAQVEEFGYELANAGSIHLEPMGIYSKKYKSLDELPEGAIILMSSSTADHGRVLSILEANGLIKLKEGVDKLSASVLDIAENPKDLKFVFNYAPELLPTIYNNNEGDAVAINSNYAIEAGLNPSKDSIALESSDSPYANIIAVKKGDENKEEIKALIEVLRSEEIQKFILEEWEGSVVPVTE